MRPLLVLLVALPLLVAGCERSEDDTSSVPGQLEPGALGCSEEDQRTASFDLGENPHTERSPGAALAFFLLGRDSIDIAKEFAITDRSKSRAEFVRGAGSDRQATIHVRRIDGGWVVIGYEYCRGALASDETNSEASLEVVYEGNPRFRTSARLYVRIIAPDDAIPAKAQVDDVAADQTLFVLREPSLTGYYVGVTASRNEPDPECGREINVDAGESAVATIRLQSLSEGASCRVSVR